MITRANINTKQKKCRTRQHCIEKLKAAKWTLINNQSFFDLVPCLCLCYKALGVKGSSTSNTLQIRLRFPYFPSAGSQRHLFDHHRWPICLHFSAALQLLSAAREPLCGWHRAARRHEVGDNGIFTVIGTQLQTSFLVLSRSVLFQQLSDVPAILELFQQ